MDFAALREALRDPDPLRLSEEELRAQVVVLVQGFNALFEAHLQLQQELGVVRTRLLAAEAEVRRLKGLPDPPDRGGGGATGEGAGARRRGRANTSSERERKRKDRSRRQGKGRKNERLQVTETVSIEIDRACLPADAVPKGYRRVLKQDLLINVRVVEMRLARYYSPSEKKTYQAPVPTGWEGGFGPVVKALTVTLSHGMNQSQAPILELVTQLGIEISAGKVCDLVVGQQDAFAAERREVLLAGIESSPWQQTDMTPTTVDGQPETCQVLGNPTYTHYHTGAGHDRAAVVQMLRAETPERYLLDEDTLTLLRERRWSERRLEQLRPHSEPYLRSREGLRRKVRHLLMQWQEEDQEEFWSCALLAGYHADGELPRVRCLLADDASIYPGVARERALCWIHELRHIKELQPVYPHYEREQQRVLRQAWRFYHDLDAYRSKPEPGRAAALSRRFDRLFAQPSSYPELERVLRRTLGKKERLLLVLKHPELPLHNNDMELAARRRVRRRDVSFGPRSRAGARAWDIFQGLAATTAKLGIRFYAYVLDRITGAGQIPRLPNLVRQRARELGLGRTWAPSPPLIE